MATIENTNYPIMRSWETKVSAMPNIPRGEKGFSDSLKCILEALKNNTPINTVVKISGSNSKNSLEELCIKLRPSGLVTKSNTVWNISKEANKWFETQDEIYLAMLLNANIKFINEILAVLAQDSKKIIDIQAVAKSEYQLSWKTNAEVHARISWLRDLDLIKYEDFSMNYSLTIAGKELLKEVGYFKPANLKIYADPTIKEEEVPLSDWARALLNLSEEDKVQRKNNIGYYPGSFQEVHNTIIDYLLMMDNPTEFSTIAEYSLSTFGISASSTKQFISNLLHLNLIVRITKTLYQRSELGRKFPSETLEMDFVLCANKKINFVFEILLELQKGNLSAKELAVIAKVSHNFSSENTSEIHKRLHILKNAKLIQEADVSKFSLTKRGENFSEILNSYVLSEQRKDLEGEISNEQESKSSKTIELLNELRISSRDSSNPNRFEEALTEAFTVLGFKSEWLGGSGKTDVLIQAPTSPKFAYSVAIDAKTTYSGGITEGQINFDTINEHRKKHNANFSVIVGREFQGERLIERARKHNVMLINIDQLEQLIKLHLDVPLKTDSYRKIFSQKGTVEVKVIEEDRNKIIREGMLLRAIIKCLSEESEDPFTEGIFQPREIYLLLKSQSNLNPSPSIAEIKQMLDFLASPLIGCIAITKEGYYAAGSLADAAHKFDFYLNACRT